jgi:hydroxymethylpyrimidine/phosphomethylpyrimidine kinase
VQNQTVPLILTFGVTDPVGALGIQADQAVFGAFGCHALTVSTGLLIADTARVDDLHEMDADWVADQARVLLEDMPVAAFKVGSIASMEQATVIAEIVSDYPDVPLVLDPFLSSLPDSGLADDDMLNAIRSILVPQATVLVLSQVELARMAETWRDGSGDGMLAADVAEITASGCSFVLVTCTGGTGGLPCSNTLYDADGIVASCAWRHLPGSFLGAGTTLSAAFCTQLALGHTPAAALQAAHDYTCTALAHARRLGMGKLVPNKHAAAAPAPAAPSALL